MKYDLRFIEPVAMRGAAMDEKGALEAINNYVHTADTHHAILLEGAWGCGKTRFVETALKARLKQDGWKVLRISAFGITSQSELFDRGIETLNVLHEATENRLANGTKVALDAGASALSSYLLSKLQTLGISFSPSSELLFSALIGPKYLLVIDDIERRAPESDEILFGAINNLIESQQRKILLVMGTTGGNELPDEVKEKLVGKTIHFEPSPSALVQDVLRDALSAYPHDIQPQETMASILEATGCRNARALIKARELIGVMGHCPFFSPTASNRLARQLTARDVWGFIVNQAQGKVPTPKDSQKDDPFLDDGNDEFERYSLLPFIQRFWKGEPTDLKRINRELAYYAEKYHPETDQEQAAMAAADKIYSAAYDDAEMQRQAQILIDAITAEQVRMANLATCIDPLLTLMAWKVIPHDTVEKLQPHIEHAVRAHCAEAYAIVENDPFWGSRTEGAKAQAYFKQLRSYIAEAFRNEETRGITDSVNSSSDTSGLQLSRYITKRLEVGHFNVSQIPLDFFIECVASSTIQSLIELRRALRRMPRRRASEEDQKWAREAISRLERIAPATNMKQVHINAMVERLRADWGPHA